MGVAQRNPRPFCCRLFNLLILNFASLANVKWQTERVENAMKLFHVDLAGKRRANAIPLFYFPSLFVGYFHNYAFKL